MRLLLIEDDRFYAKQVQVFLRERLGYEVDVVRSYEEYRELPTLEPYKYVLLDIFLHDCLECDLVDEIIKQNKPVIVITSSEDLSIFDRYNKKKIIDYVIKNDMVRLEYLIMKLKILAFMEQYGVLLVEDSSSYRRYLYNFFKIYYPYSNIMVAGDTNEALQILNENDDFIKLVVTDYVLGNNTNGLELVKEIRRNYLFEDIAVIALTGLDVNNIMTRFLKSGANDFLQKSFSNFEFVCRVDNVIKSLIQFEEIKSFVNRDYLTGCFNRRYLYDAGLKMYQVLRRAEKPISIAIFDLDHFKNLNDTYGHTAGDKVLKDFSRILQESIRGSDFVVRYGGEEFLMFLGSCDAQMAKQIIEERVRKRVENRVLQLDEGEIRYNFSCGICDTSCADSFEDLIKKADEKLYEAKRVRGMTVA
ncbi:hypothetical protein NitYY0826_C1708 [Nitratiruptor sp. YY08-26]|uniref:GGDEF domain-containing response regulator n=1 Tax=unclassified Nitratiruptor TaxID=2624044 RepID=UPI0019158822|nr:MULTISPECIES: response regulator [unclassified Nitratiruptor]BCD62823.1 hypothetical protein NitYY0813_C1706 [Nitratiruptor sp. YY08-13]BCD66759.1 hypothetical protein NitYY0826_C1708 [Nitratiruptor sp. YY08-26]